MVYLLIITVLKYTALPTEDPNVFDVTQREITESKLFLRRDEAMMNYHKERALGLYVPYVSVKLDSFPICPIK